MEETEDELPKCLKFNEETDGSVCDRLAREDLLWFAKRPRARFMIRNMDISEMRQLIKTSLMTPVLRGYAELRDYAYDRRGEFMFTVIKNSIGVARYPSYRVEIDGRDQDILLGPTMQDEEIVLREFTPQEIIKNEERFLEALKNNRTCQNCGGVSAAVALYFTAPQFPDARLCSECIVRAHDARILEKVSLHVFTVGEPEVRLDDVPVEQVPMALGWIADRWGAFIPKVL